MVRLHEIENWARQTIRRAAAGGQQEDSLVELKAKWPEPRWTARQLAGHANAAGGAPILWLIGVDQKEGVLGCENIEIGDWYNQLKAEFEGGVAPALLGHPTFEHEGKFVVPLLFTTDRPPYVVKNPARDTPKAGPFSLDVPWREGTAVRSAGRAELLRMLTSTPTLPSVELLRGQAVITPAQKVATNLLDPERWLLSVEVELYVTPRGEETVVIPYHRVVTKLRARGGGAPVVLTGGYMRAGAWRRVPTTHDEEESLTITATRDELIVEGPGKIAQYSSLRGPTWATVPEFEVLEIEWHIAGVDIPVVFSAPLEHVEIGDSERKANIVAAWLVRGSAG